MTAAAILSPADLAATLGTDPRTARKFLRSITPADQHPGKGSRWTIKGTKTELTRLTKAFRAFEAEQAESRAKRAETTADAPEIEPTIDDTADIADSLDTIDGPTDDELDALEN